MTVVCCASRNGLCFQGRGNASMNIGEFLDSLPTYRRNAWLFFRSFRDRDELIQNAIGNAWIVYYRTGKQPRFRLCCFQALNQWFGVRALSHHYRPGSRVLRQSPSNFVET